MAFHLASLWNRGLGHLGISLFALKETEKCRCQPGWESSRHAQSDTVGYRRVDVYLRRSLKESNSATYS